MKCSIRLRHYTPLFCLILSGLLGTLLPCPAQQGESGERGPEESSIHLDPFLGFEFGPLLTLDRTPGSWIWCSQCSGDGISYNTLVRFGASLGLPEFPFWKLETITRLSFSVAGGEFTSYPFGEPLIDPESNEVTQTTREFNVSALTAALGLDFLFGGEVIEKFRFYAGPSADYRIFSRFVHTERLLEPFDAVYIENGLNSRIVAEGDLLATSPLTFGLAFALSRPVPLSDNLTIVPELYTRLNGPAFLEGLGTRSFSTGIGIAFQLSEPQPRFALTPPPLPEALSPSPPPAPPQPAFSAHINLYCLDDNGTQAEEGHLLPRNTVIRRRTPPEEESIVHDFYVPQIGVAPEIVAEAGVRWWGLSIRQGKEEIARVTSDAPEESLDLNVHIEHGEPPIPLTAELLVEDSTGAVIGARDQLSFFFDSTATFDGKEEGRNEHSYIEDWWILSEPDGTFDNLIPRNQHLVDDIVAAAMPKGKASPEEVQLLLFPASPPAASATLSESSEAVWKEKLQGLARHLEREGLSPLLSPTLPDTESLRNIGSEEKRGFACLVIVRQRTSFRYGK